MEKRNSSSQDWNEEYSFLLKSPKMTPPGRVGVDVKRAIHAELNPSAWSVFCKLFAIHFVSGTVTLVFCPQLGFQIHETARTLLVFLSRFGEYGCMLVCGALFLGSTGFFAAFLLKPQEVRAIRKSRGLQWAFLSFLSVGFFLAVREQEHSLPLALIAAWSAGALFGGFFVFRVSYSVRMRLQQLRYQL